MSRIEGVTNWINTLVHYASVSGVLAGFCVTFIALILGGSIADVDICTTGTTFGQLSVLLFGISAALFVGACQRFLHAQDLNVWDLPKDYRKFIEEELEKKNVKWDSYLLDNDAKSRHYEKEGRLFYNLAILFMLSGLLLAVVPYNKAVAVIIAVIGYSLELWLYIT